MATSDQPVMTIRYDDRSGMGMTVEAWGIGDRTLVGLTFISHFREEAHDLTLDQARQLRDLLIRVLGE